MKIERLSENQIRCTLNKSDLASRQLKINELAYGSEKAKELFRDMMLQASYELGFDVDDTPVMIEAIPVSAECIVLIVTKVDNPEELDTRFSRFSPADDFSDSDFDDNFDFDDMETIEGNSTFAQGDIPTANAELENETAASSDEDNADSFLGADLANLFNKVKEYLNKNSSTKDNTTKENSSNQFVPLKDINKNSKKKEEKPANSDKKAAPETALPVTRVYTFNSLDDISNVAKVIDPIYSDFNSVYKKPNDDLYYLVLCRKTCSPVNFNKVCNILSEYGSKEASCDNSLGFFEEHYNRIIERKAIKVLSHL